jgi:8-oxo-dGTP diphosphatase
MIKERKIGAGIGVMLLRDGKILLGKRNEDPEKASSALNGAGTWTMPGGKLDFGESFEDAARRETMEETGIALKDIKVIAVNNNKSDSAQFVTVGLVSESFEGEAKAMEPDEITEWKWFELDKLPKPMYFPSAKIVKNYLSSEFYIPTQEK